MLISGFFEEPFAQQQMYLGSRECRGEAADAVAGPRHLDFCFRGADNQRMSMPIATLTPLT